MDIKQIIKDARDPNSKDNIFRLFWAEYQRTAAHIKDRNILCFPMKTLEANVQLLAKRLKDLRMADKDQEVIAQEILELIEKSQATMNELLKL